MSFAQDILRQYQQSTKKVYGRAGEKPVEFVYTMGYRSRGRGCKRTLTWLIPLAQIKSWVRESKPGAITVWPYVSTEEQMIRRQIARVHHLARENNWHLKTARLANGLRIMYCGAKFK